MQKELLEVALKVLTNSDHEWPNRGKKHHSVWNYIVRATMKLTNEKIRNPNHRGSGLGIEY